MSLCRADVSVSVLSDLLVVLMSRSAHAIMDDFARSAQVHPKGPAFYYIIGGDIRLGGLGHK